MYKLMQTDTKNVFLIFISYYRCLWESRARFFAPNIKFTQSTDPSRRLRWWHYYKLQSVYFTYLWCNYKYTKISVTTFCSSFVGSLGRQTLLRGHNSDATEQWTATSTYAVTTEFLQRERKTDTAHNTQFTQTAKL